MAIDIPRRVRKATQKRGGRKECVSPNPQLNLLARLYSFLARRTDSKFNSVVAKRLIMSRRNKAPIGLWRLVKHMKGYPDRIACVVATVTDDYRQEIMPKMSVCALRFTEAARKRIEAAGGECITFDALALRSPEGKGCVLLRGHTKSRKAEKYFGRAPGLPGSHTRPRGNCKQSH